MANMSIDEAFRLAVEHHQQGRPVEAENIYRQLIAQQPGHADSHYMLAALGYEMGRPADALPLARRAVELSPGNADFHILTGVLLATTDQTQQAIESFRQAAALRPNDPSALNNLANALRQVGRADEALETYQKSVLVQPDVAEVYANMSNALLDLGRAEDAIEACRKAIALKPGYSGAYSDMGNALVYLGRYDEAIDAYGQAIAFQPANAEASFNLGNAYKEKGQLDEALSSYRQSLALRPNFPSAAWNMGTTLLLKGDFAAGWDAYESRWGMTTQPANRGFSQPMWDGSALDGRSILLHTEQGFGDAIQFLRFVTPVKARGGKVSLLCQPELRRLFDGQLGLQKVVSDEASLPHFEVQCPLMSVPQILQIGGRIPADVPYLKADPSLVSQWKARIGEHPAGLKVGLVWSGRTGHPKQNRRAISLSSLAPLANVPGAQFYSLQKGPTTPQEKTSPPALNLVDWTNDLADFADTAALIQNLDLVISIDTAVGHLAGAMGKPVWLLLGNVPDWRWMLNRTDSPWYPTMRLFRQPRVGDWESVIGDVRQALSEETRKH